MTQHTAVPESRQSIWRDILYPFPVVFAGLCLATLLILAMIDPEVVEACFR